MKAEQIARIEATANRMARKYDTRDPYELADWLDCIVDMEEYPALLGFCSIVLGNRVIGLNSRADYYTRRCTCAHELGHLILRHISDATFKPRHQTDFTNTTAHFEFEANCFAAALLLPDTDTIDCLQTYNTLERTAQALYVCPELLISKLQILNAKGVRMLIPELGKQAWRMA